MPEPSLSMTMDNDDLPRTLRRERDARERAAREREAPPMGSQPPQPMPLHAARDDDYDLPAPAATVTSFEVPFVKLMLFLIKVVLAGIPALVLLTAILWGLGVALKTFLPWLVHMKITIFVPQ